MNVTLQKQLLWVKYLSFYKLQTEYIWNIMSTSVTNKTLFHLPHLNLCSHSASAQATDFFNSDISLCNEIS